MRGTALSAIMLLGLALAGCKSDDDAGVKAVKPIDQMTTPEWCEFYRNFLSTNKETEEIRQADIKAMHARGCPADVIPAK